MKTSILSFSISIISSLKAYFWRKVKDVIKQNKKDYLFEFLFDSSPQEVKVKKVEKRILELEKKVYELENQRELENQNSTKLDFRPLNDIPNLEEELREILKLSQKSSLPSKDFFEGREEESLLQLKGYRLNFQNLKRTKIYKQLVKEVDN